MAIDTAAKREAALLAGGMLTPDGSLTSRADRGAMVDYYVGSIAAALAGVVLRQQDATNYLRAYVDTTNEKIKLDKVESGTPTNIAQADWTPANGSMRVIAQASRIRVWWNRKLYIDETDTTFATETDAGIYAKDSTSSRFDDWYGQGV